MTGIARSATPPNAAAAARRASFGDLRGRPVLVATDGSPAASAAARLGAALAAERGAIPHALRVRDTAQVGLPAPLPVALALADELIGAEVHEPDVRAVRAELAAFAGDDAGEWPVHIGLGVPARVTVRTAGRIGAALVVMGLRRHEGVDRVLRDETTLNVMRRAPCPVLGATPALVDLPRRAAVGVDLDGAAPDGTALDVARAAVGVLHASGTLLLVHVEPVRRRPDRSPDAAGGDAAAVFERLVEELAPPSTLAVERVSVPGQPECSVAEQLLAVADRSRTDLIAVAGRRHRWLDRALRGSVTVDLARDGRRSLLVVPPPAADGDDAGDERVAT
jgi:nucleotide-binding universal stress UspA family protein